MARKARTRRAPARNSGRARAGGYRKPAVRGGNRGGGRGRATSRAGGGGRTLRIVIETPQTQSPVSRGDLVDQLASAQTVKKTRKSQF